MTHHEAVERWYAEGDPALLAADVRWTVLPTYPEGGTYTGKAAVLHEFLPKIAARFALYAVEPERLVVDGDTIVVLGRYRAKGLNGAPAVSRFAHVWTVREGRLARFDQAAADTVAIRAALAP